MADKRIALVAGGAGAVGEGIVRQLLLGGYSVIVPSRSQKRLAELNSLVAASGDLHTIVADIGNQGGADQLREKIEFDFGRPHCVVASVGGWWEGSPLTRVDVQTFREVLDMNLMSQFVIARTFLPLVASWGASGTYIVIGGSAATVPVAMAGLSSITGAAGLMMTNVLAAENEESGVRVHELVMGPVATRKRPNAPSSWITPDGVGTICTAIASSIECAPRIIHLEHKVMLEETLSRLPAMNGHEFSKP